MCLRAPGVPRLYLHFARRPRRGTRELQGTIPTDRLHGCPQAHSSARTRGCPRPTSPTPWKAATQVPAASLAKANRKIPHLAHLRHALEEDRGDGHKGHAVRFLDFAARVEEARHPRRHGVRQRSPAGGRRVQEPDQPTPGRPKRSSSSVGTRKATRPGRTWAHGNLRGGAGLWSAPAGMEHLVLME